MIISAQEYVHLNAANHLRASKVILIGKQVCQSAMSQNLSLTMDLTCQSLTKKGI